MGVAEGMQVLFFGKSRFVLQLADLFSQSPSSWMWPFASINILFFSFHFLCKSLSGWQTLKSRSIISLVFTRRSYIHISFLIHRDQSGWGLWANSRTSFQNHQSRRKTIHFSRDFHTGKKKNSDTNKDTVLLESQEQHLEWPLLFKIARTFNSQWYHLKIHIILINLEMCSVNKKRLPFIPFDHCLYFWCSYLEGKVQQLT